MSDRTDDLSNNEALELRKIRIRHEMQEEITSWAKKRFTMLGVVVAVLGFFGLSTVMHQSLQVLLTKPVERELAKLDKAMETARETIAELSVLSREVGEKGRQAQSAAADAAIKIQQLEKNIDTVSSDAEKIRDSYAHIRGGMSRVSADIFALASSISEEEKRLKVEIKKTSQTLNALEDLSTSVAKSFRSTQVDSALENFRSDIDAINAEYIREIDRINKIRTFNIVYYIRSIEEEEAAEAIVRELKSQGFRAAVWYAQGGNRSAVIQEIASEFGEIADILEAHVSGVVSHPEHEDVAQEIETLLSTKFTEIGHKAFNRPLQPAEQHLLYDHGKKSFDADRVILMYSLGPANT